MNTKHNYAKGILVYGLSIAIAAGLTFAMSQIVVENSNNVSAQQQEKGQQKNQTSSSIPHNAKGHESHQVIIFHNSSDDTTYSGSVTFNISKPADVISFKKIADGEPTNATKKIWEVGDQKFLPKTLLKNATNGSVIFNGSGILAHSAFSDIYTGSFTVNNTTSSNL